MDEADYIVVGGGSAGCAAAGRLAERRRDRILLIEAGGSDKTLPILMPAATYLYALGNPRYDYRYESDPDPTRNNRVDYLPRGRVLGGTSSINGMLYVRGNPADYDEWASMGCKGWDFASLLPLFKRSENNENGASELHGAGGHLYVSNLRVCHPLNRAFLEAAVASGMARTDDINAIPQRGIGFAQTTSRRGVRVNAARAYLWWQSRNPFLNIELNCSVTKIMFAEGRATGVIAGYGPLKRQIRAHKGVILCAGAYASPQLLMASGVGDEGHLRGLGISVVHDLPGVGQNLQEHPGVPITARVNVPTYNSQATWLHKMWFGARWLLTGTGPGSSPDSHIVGFIEPDIRTRHGGSEFHFGPVGYELDRNGARLLPYPSATCFVNVSRPWSRGHVRLRSPDVDNQPLIQHNLLKDERDIVELVAGARFLKRILDTEPMLHSVVDILNYPKDDSQAEWTHFLRSQAAGIYHPAGTCAMGHAPDSVVDDRLRVHGLENLYVADASVMPVIISGNLNATCMVIGEKCAEMLSH